MQVINDGADEKDFQELLNILKQFGDVQVLYDPDDPKDKNTTADDVIKRYDEFAKKAREDGSTRKDSVQETTRGSRTSSRKRRKIGNTNTKVSAAA